MAKNLQKELNDLLYKFLRKLLSKPLDETLPIEARRIIESYVQKNPETPEIPIWLQDKNLIYSTWERDWRLNKELAWAKFGDQEGDRDEVARARHQAFTELVRFVLDAKTDRLKSKYSRQLQDALCDYFDRFDDDRYHVPNNKIDVLENDVTKLKKTIRRPLTKREKLQSQRNKFSKPRRAKKQSWPTIYAAYVAKYPTDTTASPGALRLCYQRYCSAK